MPHDNVRTVRRVRTVRDVPFVRIVRAVLPREFYDRPTLTVAQDLLGKVLVHRTPAGEAAGMIVETEAYIGEDDPACHAAPGPTRRNAPLYGPPGRAYVYLNYGIHYLVNAVTESEGFPAAVLIRALDPLDGLDLMARRRGLPTGAIHDPDRRHRICRGPGNLTVAMGITLARNRVDICEGPLAIEDHCRRHDWSGKWRASGLVDTRQWLRKG